MLWAKWGDVMRLLLLAATLIAVAIVAPAQTPSASIVGRVTDPTGAVTPGVTVKVTNLDTNISQQASSNQVGDFTVPYLNPGRYTLETTAAGFRSYRHLEFNLVVDQVLRIDIPLELGTASETVTVTDAPPVLNTESGARGEVTSNLEIADIPLD